MLNDFVVFGLYAIPTPGGWAGVYRLDKETNMELCRGGKYWVMSVPHWNVWINKTITMY